MISLLHPSRGRPEKSYRNAMEWIDKSGCDVELIVSLDKSDDWNSYLNLYEESVGIQLQIIVNDNSSVVEATNKAAATAIGDHLLYLSDDFKCFDGWGKIVQEEFKKYAGPTLIKVDDCLQQFKAPVLTIPIMNIELYHKLGYFWHPEYKSMWVDCDLYETVNRIGALKFAEHIKFAHEHVSIGKAEDDETYRRSAANWAQGEAIFKRRRREHFKI